MSNPITAFPNTNYKEFNFTRKYRPEGDINNIINISYSDYIKDYEYNTYLSSELDNLSDIEKNKKLSVIPYKVVLAKGDNGLPKEGRYYVNCDGWHKDDKYYYTVENSKIIKLPEKSIKDDLINNYFHYPVIKKFNSFTIPQEKDGKKPYIDNLGIQVFLHQFLHYTLTRIQVNIQFSMMILFLNILYINQQPFHTVLNIHRF
jgi:hypothetical protein